MTAEARYPWGLASVVGTGAVVAAFAAAWMLQDSEMLSRIPPGATQPDVAEGDTLTLYQSAFTAWAALVLLLPVYATVWMRNRSAKAWGIWMTFWVVSFEAYVIHLAVSAFGFFGGDFGWMTTSTRVSAFWPGMLVLVWWGLDLLLLRKPDQGWVAVQRGLLHLAVFVLFVGGSAIKGETMLIQMMGWGLFGLGALAAADFWRRHRNG